MEDQGKDATILTSWQKNVDAWTRAVRQSKISSRVAVTDAAIVNAIVAQAPKTVLDLGCGEGWLVRSLTELGVMAEGVDGIAGLIRCAKDGGGKFSLMSYEDFAVGAWQKHVDCVVCNFALLGHQVVEDVLAAIPSVLSIDGKCIIQTLHPAYSDQSYYDGWREGSWAGFSDDFCDPAPWYFRTLSSWFALFTASGFKLAELIEPLNPQTGEPASIIFVLRPEKKVAA
ncbi:class I SAM-dependent methyltransferase [Zhongshania borealis]|uniref:Class I SAM-dependent methyltransferase n=1 Tax=Zhongshania borealis TaxID=889488 RepID=A0ABP7W7X5_9GAMM